MAKWHIIADESVPIEVEARFYQINDNNIGGFFNDAGKVIHSVPADRVIVIQISDDKTD